MHKVNDESIIGQLIERYPKLEALVPVIEKAAEMIIFCYSNGGKVLVCGNGGSSSDADHIVGELMKSFELKRPVENDLAKKLAEISEERGSYLAQKLERALPAISLSSQTALTTAISNDIDGSIIFAQQVLGYGKNNDVLVALSCSGNSQNIIDACITAKAMNLKVIGLTGMTGGNMKQYCDILINVPEKRTAYVQELHLPVFHALCLIIEKYFYSTNKKY